MQNPSKNDEEVYTYIYLIQIVNKIITYFVDKALKLQIIVNVLAGSHNEKYLCLGN